MMRLIRNILYLLLMLSVAGCGGKKQETDKKDSGTAIEVKDVTIETVASEAIPETAELTGTVKARTSSVVSTRIPGTIKMLQVREGDRVRKGQILIRLEANETVATAAAATAGIDEAERALNQALASKKLSDSTFDRYSKLFNEQAVTRQEFETKQNEKELADQGVARAEARLKQARESSKAAVSMADYTRISAPISGIITSRVVDLGTTVFPAQPLLIIEDEGSYQLELSVPESLAIKIKHGTPVQITLDALKTTFNSKIEEIVPAADPASRTFTAKIALERKGLRSGMFGRGSINLDTSFKTILLPQKAIVERGALNSVWVVDKDKHARMRLVKVGKIVIDKLEIIAGLQDGERVVVNGVEKISEGATVE